MSEPYTLEQLEEEINAIAWLVIHAAEEKGTYLPYKVGAIIGLLEQALEARNYFLKRERAEEEATALAALAQPPEER